MKPTIDPRHGDVEDDASSTKRRALLSLAGRLVADISPRKLAVAWFLLIAGPGLVLGVAPVVAAVWLSKRSSKLEYPVAGIWPLVILAIIVALGWFGRRMLFRLAENSFWSLNSLAVQPAYTMCREALRQLAEGRPAARATKAQRLGPACRGGGGVRRRDLRHRALAELVAVLPHADLMRDAEGVGECRPSAVVALATTVVPVAGYLAVTALVWAIADVYCNGATEKVAVASRRERFRPIMAHCDIDGARHEPDYGQHFLRADVLRDHGRLLAATVLTLISLPALRCLVSGHGAGVIAEAMSGDAVIGWRV